MSPSLAQDLITRRSVGLIVESDFTVMNFAALTVFEFANRMSGKALYDVYVLSEQGGAIKSSLGMEVATRPFGKVKLDTLFIGGASDLRNTSSALVSYLQKSAASGIRIASICLGAFALGAAGLLDGRGGTTHWGFTSELQMRFPECIVEPDRIYMADRGIWTSAGMSAGTDLALGMLEADQGRDFANLVADCLVLHHRRSGGQSQHSVLLQLDPVTDKIQTALAYAKAHLNKALRNEDLARIACLSLRQFTRVFREETGTSPAKAVTALRLEAAKLMLEQSRLPVEAVAIEAGFIDSERMRRAFIRVYGRAPQSFRIEAGPVATM